MDFAINRIFSALKDIVGPLHLAGHAPRVVLRASHEGALAYCSLDDLKRFAIDLA
jgi:hypothetical protein